ncbi:FecCD family ABC transporter permease [Microbacterium sp. NPDC058342]|uniref:FecCD family ABC transporter permease n=1 Tax=Microbacterium sp. NPDC058342 TaxID=3346454 RepID=UPI00364A3FFF
MVAALSFAVILSLVLGSRTLSLGDVWAALTSPSGTDADIVVLDLRLPRTLLGLVVGGCLGVAGAVMQTLTRNPLAEPGLFGVSAGSSLAVVIGLQVAAASSMTAQVGWALGGALAATALVFGVTARLGASGVSPVTLAVMGVAVSAALAAITSAIVLLDADTLDGYRFWAVGALSGRGSAVAAQVLPFVAAGLALAMLCARDLDHFLLGDDLAISLGVRVTRLRLAGILAIALLTGAAVAACGPIAFIGLLAAHAGRALVGTRHLLLLPVCAALGAAALLLADVVGRLVAGTGELQVGVVLGAVGGPLFLATVARRRIVL